MSTLYIHVPFCEKKCFYCSFVVAIGQENLMHDYVLCLEKEAENYEGREIDSIYFGGGTPSKLSTKNFFDLMKKIKSTFIISDDAEISVEVNPEDMEPDLLSAYRGCGVTRISMGVQTFNDSFLKFLGRCHGAQTAFKAYSFLRSADFQNINIDLMYGFPGQTVAHIGDDIKALRRLSPEHVSIYTLTVEKNSRFFVDHIELPSQEELTRQYNFVCEQLERIGYYQYEVSNFSKPLKESLHNINYWTSGNYIGLGVGAHSHSNGVRSWNVDRLRSYIQQMNEDGSAKQGSECLPKEKQLSEALVFGLRMIKGVNLESLERRFDCSLDQEKIMLIKQFKEEGFFQYKNDCLCVTQKGVLVLDELSSFLV